MADPADFTTTPFGAQKSAEQSVQFAFDPSRGLTRERIQWYSNGSRFDSSHFADGEGEIDIQTGANSGDTARIQSVYAGQYVAQALAQPGIKVYIAPENVEIDADGHTSLSHGRVEIGPFTRLNGEIYTGFGIRIDTDGMWAVWYSQGEHQGNSPVHQRKWRNDKLNALGESGLRYDPSKGYVLNFPYTWYNNGKLSVAILNASQDSLIRAHSFVPPDDGEGRASLATPNLPVQFFADNGSTAESLTAAIGGMQFSLYGAQDSGEKRDSFMAEKGVSVDTAAGDPVDPISTPGTPIYAVRREPEAETLEITLDNIDVEPDGDIFLYVWDEWDTSSLTGANFREPFSNFLTETRARVDTAATAYDNSNGVLRKVIPAKSGGGSNTSATDAAVDDPIPLDATRIVTAVGQTSSTISLDYVAKNIEGF